MAHPTELQNFGGPCGLHDSKEGVSGQLPVGRCNYLCHKEVAGTWKKYHIFRNFHRLP